jgi:hypothetical protein
LVDVSSPPLFSAFSLQEAQRKRTSQARLQELSVLGLRKKETPFLRGAAPAPCELLKKLDQNF